MAARQGSPSDFATKNDVQAVRGDLEELREATKGDLKNTESGIRADMRKMESSIRHDIASLAKMVRVIMDHLGISEPPPPAR